MLQHICMSGKRRKDWLVGVRVEINETFGRKIDGDPNENKKISERKRERLETKRRVCTCGYIYDVMAEY